jgi:hypothetical protein
MKTHTKATAKQMVKLLSEVWPGSKILSSSDNKTYLVYTDSFDLTDVLCDVLHEIVDFRDLIVRKVDICNSAVLGVSYIYLHLFDLTEADTMVIDDLTKGQIKGLVRKYKLVRDLEEHPVKVLFKKVYGFFFN